MRSKLRGSPTNLFPVVVQPLDDVEVTVPGRQYHRIHGAPFLAISRQELEEFQVPPRGGVIYSGGSASLLTVVVQKLDDLKETPFNVVFL